MFAYLCFNLLHFGELHLYLFSKQVFLLVFYVPHVDISEKSLSLGETTNKTQEQFHSVNVDASEQYLLCLSSLYSVFELLDKCINLEVTAVTTSQSVCVCNFAIYL